jgi:hypothetical protein
LSIGEQGFWRAGFGGGRKVCTCGWFDRNASCRGGALRLGPTWGRVRLRAGQFRICVLGVLAERLDVGLGDIAAGGGGSLGLEVIFGGGVVDPHGLGA